MTPEGFRELRRSFERLISLTPVEQEQALAEISASDPEQCAELRRLLREHGRRTALMDGPAPEIAEARETETRQLGPYLLEREIGRGGMGVVYEAVRADGSFRKRVAIKILRRDQSSRLFLTRFHQERQILARLEHPHIAAILDGGETPQGDPYFVMEYVDGVPLTTYAEKHRLTVARRLDLFLQVCDALQYAHRNLTVHRDLKPGNILVTEAGAVKLLDFGVAKLLEAEGASEAPATVAMLTPAYTSPEQIRREPASTAGDVFQLGILLYELLTGENPFHRDGQLPHEAMRAICEDDPAPPSAAAKRDARQIRGELDAIVLTALRKQPAWRYSSVEQMADDISRYRRGWPVLATGNRLGYRVQKFMRRHWLPLAATALLMALLAAGIVITTHQAQMAEQAREAADEQRRVAENAQRVASEQRSLAESRTREAESERQRAQERYRDVRALASSMLFDLYDGVRDLAGSATARRLIVAKVQKQLELLNADASHDAGLERDLAASYERMGELRVDPRQPKQNDSGAAIQAYREALRLRREIAARSDATADDRRDLALSIAKLAYGEYFTGNTKQSVADYRTARSMMREHGGPRSLGTVDERLCIVLLAAGDNAGAMDACREGIDALTPLGRTLPDDVEVQRLLATTEASYANALRLSGKAREAGPEAKLALESLHRLEGLAPSNAEYRRLTSTAETILAGSLAASGDPQGSLEAFDRSIRSMEIAIEIDPSDLGGPLRLAVTLLAFSKRLAQGPQKERAHDAAREAMRLLEATSEKPGAGVVEWNEYANALLQSDWPDLRAPERALALASRAAVSSGFQNPSILDTLAWAYFRNGDAAKAVETERKALGLLPADAKGGLHDELTRGMGEFVSAVDKGK